MKKKIISLILCLCMLMGMTVCGLGAYAVSAEPELPAEETAEAPALDGDAPQVNTVTVTLTLSDEDGASFEGGAKSADIPVYEGGSIYVGTDGDGDTAVVSTYGDVPYFYEKLSMDPDYDALGILNVPATGITSDCEATVEIVRTYSMTIKTNADNRGGITRGEAGAFIPTSQLVNMKFYQGGRLWLADYTDEYEVLHEDALVAYNYMDMIGDGFYPESQTGYKFDRWEGLPADETVNGDLELTAWFVPIADTETTEQTGTAVAEGVDESVANNTDMTKASVTGLKEALDDQIVEFLMSEGVGLSEADANNSATQVEVNATVQVTLTEGSAEALTFSVKPTATVTKNGSELAKDAAIANSYLNKPMTVVIPCGGIVPTAIEHRNAEGALIETFTADGDPAFTYDAASDTVTLQVTEFSSLTIGMGHAHDGVLFDKTLDSSFTGGELASGNYYLTGDITLASTVVIPEGATVKLCLNGHVLKLDGLGGSVIAVGGELTLYDCGEDVVHYFSVGDDGLWTLDEENGTEPVFGGVITGGKPDENGNDGGGVFVVGSGSFTMNGGSITGNSAFNYGAGMTVYGGSFTMNGGSITGNITKDDNTYVVVAFGGSITVGGTARITGNTLADGTTASNVWISNGKTITVQEGFSGKVGVTMESGLGAFTGANTADYSKCFTSDDSTYVVSCGANNVLSLLRPLTVSGTTASGKSYDGSTAATAKRGTVSGIVGGDDVTVSVKSASFADKNAGADKEVTVVYQLSGDDAAKYATPANDTVKADISPKSVAGLTVQMDCERYLVRAYGAEAWPSVFDGETELFYGTDFDLSYENNAETGTATMTLNGIGNYSGKITKDYEAVELEDATEVKGFSGLVEGGAKQDAVLTLGEGTDLTLELVGKVFVALDGVELTDEECKVEDGCIKVTVYKETLNKLKSGKHTLSAVIPELDMVYDLGFTVSAKPASAVSTGDNGHALLWALLLGGCTLCTATLLRKRRG